VYWYVTPKSDTRLPASKTCKYAINAPTAVPSLGLDENTGTRSHGDGASSAAAGGAVASGRRSCADADTDNARVPKSTDRSVTNCFAVAPPSSAAEEAPFVAV
jgi:hypothetical protein